MAAKTDPGSRLSLAALIVAITALAGVVALTAVLASIGVFDSTAGTRPLTGQPHIAPDPNTPLAGDNLAATVKEVIEADGGTVTRMTCPDTPVVKQGVVTVCHGVVSGGDWAVVVFFEDAAGRFTLQPI